MRYFFFFLAAVFLLTGCGNNTVEFTGTVLGANTGKVMISNSANEIIYQGEITKGKFYINKQALQSAGFYQLVCFAGNSQSAKHEIYLEPGVYYTIDIDARSANAYPKITSTSKKQADLSAYQDMLKAAKESARAKVMSYDAEMHKLDDEALTFTERDTRMQQLRNKQLDANVVDMVALFNAFVKQHADSEITPHLMLNTEYQLNPVGYNEVFKKLSSAAKSTDEGKQLEEKLNQLTRLAAGGEAPEIEGTTPDGKTVDLKALNKKVIIVDFWRALNSQSLRDHIEMATNLLPKYKGKGLDVVSVSFDDNRVKWLAYIAKSNMTWTQVSDLKGDASPNGENWAITKIPTYYLLEGNGRIIKRCTDYYELEVAVNDYMAKH
ncbi:TlpA family protein disulfide reductase [Mucilaginibacter calamicampi]|uniref:TlpA family protein disulfide reductase n=1 Tax=Mucilaginibacter calamicampi TaxID=1302352 RepID=A0ABW2YYR8_9SPHI